MKQSLLIAALLALAVVGCAKKEEAAPAPEAAAPAAAPAPAPAPEAAPAK
jgi:PBP1b-binding outer membrane lipoprotein LpoB